MSRSKDSLLKELAGLSADDLSLILRDQTDLYSPDERAIIRREWESRQAAEETRRPASQQPAVVCPFCGRYNSPGCLYCAGCGNPLALTTRLSSPSTHEDREWRGFLNVFCYILSLLNPLRGLLLGLFYRQSHTRRSRRCLLFAGISLAFWVLLAILMQL